MPNNLADELLYKQTVHANIITRWNSVIEKLKKYHIDRVVDVPIGITNKYKGDLYGLFKEINIDDEFIYPHIKVNGYDNAIDYDGTKTKFYIINRDTLVLYNILFNKK